MRARPISPEALEARLGDRVAGQAPGAWLRVGVDGAPPARPDALAGAVAERVRLLGRPVLRLRASDYLRPASLRFERGRTNPDAYYDDWIDYAAINREALAPLSAGGSGLVRVVHREPDTDRASRSPRVALPPGGVLILSGAMLLGAGLALDLVVHLAVSGAALVRRMPADLAWAIPAFERYAVEVSPTLQADWVVLLDDPRHPAILDQTVIRDVPDDQ
ncbi:uridine kinase [Luedemannella helvata]|uniref:Uridine kinase n=1 Tax=Luedemannella helvata TaxID=349315 RepID=A0ABP4WSX2_9ACTN